jgi:hypothetical protein
MNARYPFSSSASLALRALELRALPIDDARLSFDSGRALRYRFRISPSEYGRIYECELCITPGLAPPEMIVLEPDLARLAGGDMVPHIYPWRGKGTKLCLWWPKNREWLPQMGLSETYVAWTAEWLWYFEDWLSTRAWAGAGEHPRKRRKRWGAGRTKAI